MTPEKARLIKSAIVPSSLIAFSWAIRIFESISGIDLSMFGILPLQQEGLYGIFCSPFLHADYSHVLANSVPFFVLGSALFFFYSEIAVRVLLMSWLFTGIWVWCFARGGAYHIGASGVVYALASFHFFSGLIRREPRLMAFTLLVVFLYGSMVWGVFPDFFPTKNISWESHLMGLLAGFILAFYYRKSGPQRSRYEWADEDIDESEYPADEPEILLPEKSNSPENDLPESNESAAPGEIKINYIFKKN
jgi:membrane associated rhomboid family serine protease